MSFIDKGCHAGNEIDAVRRSIRPLISVVSVIAMTPALETPIVGGATGPV